MKSPFDKKLFPFPFLKDVIGQALTGGAGQKETHSPISENPKPFLADQMDRLELERERLKLDAEKLQLEREKEIKRETAISQWSERLKWGALLAGGLFIFKCSAEWLWTKGQATRRLKHTRTSPLQKPGPRFARRTRRRLTDSRPDKAIESDQGPSDPQEQ